MSESVGDMAGRVAAGLREQHIGEIERGERVVEEDVRELASEARSMFTKMDFRWRESDRLALEQVRAGAAAAFQNEFAAAIGIVDRLYAQVRVPQVHPQYGTIVLDAQQRPIWQLGPDGRPVEDWSRLTGQDIEGALFALKRLELELSAQRSALLADALFAKHIHDDTYYDAYADVVDGTVKDREARASRQGRVEKYHAYFRFVLWEASDSFSKEIRDFKRLLEKTLNWNVWNNPAAGRG